MGLYFPIFKRMESQRMEFQRMDGISTGLSYFFGLKRRPRRPKFQAKKPDFQIHGEFHFFTIRHF